MDKHFRALRVIATIFKILAWAVLVLGALFGIILLFGGLAGGVAAGYRGFLVGPALLIGSILQFLFFYATGEAIYLALAIEENTRETAYYLKGGDNLPHRV